MLKVEYPGQKVMLTNFPTWYEVPARMASVLELFSSRKCFFINTFISLMMAGQQRMLSWS